MTSTTSCSGLRADHARETPLVAELAISRSYYDLPSGLWPFFHNPFLRLLQS